MLQTRLRALVLLAALLAPAAAAAQPKGAREQALAKANDALQLYESGRHAAALVIFQEADSLYHAPTVSIYVARCQRKVGRLREARATYERILGEDLPKDAPSAFVAAHADAGKELTELRSRIPTLRITVTGAAAGSALVTVDGAPFPDERKEIDPGSHTIELRVPGATPVTRTITVAEGQAESITLEASAPKATSSNTPPPERGPHRGPAIALFAVGGAGLVAGGVLGGLALSAAGSIKHDAEALCPAHPTSCPNADLDARKSAAGTKAWISNISVAVGVAGVAAGAVLYALGLPKAAEAARTGSFTVRF